MGSQYLLEGKYPEALKELLVAEQLDPKEPQIQNNLGIAYYVRGKYQTAERHIRRAIELKPTFTDARNNLGRTLIALGLYDEAISELEVACNDLTFKEPAKSWSNLGEAYFAKGNFEKAQSSLSRSLEIQPKHCQTFIKYGRSLFELKDFEKAALALDQSITLCKGEAADEARYYGAISHYRLKKKQEAIARLEEVIKGAQSPYFSSKSQTLLQYINSR
jgi:Tfp pilus assembly protein PilF